MRAKTLALLVTVSAIALAQVARADVEINTRPTANMSCDAGVCTATAQKAVLNVSDLATMLASGDVAVKTGLVAKDIEISQPLTWSNTSRLTLDAQQSVTIKKQVTVAGQGALTVTTNDTGQPHAKNKTGEFIIVPEHGSVQLWDPSSSLIIDGQSYTLVYDIKTLAADIAANPSGFYALAKPYDASVDGTYTASPISTEFTGTFDGLGNTVSRLDIALPASSDPGGMFIYVRSGGAVRDIGLPDIKVRGAGSSALGTLAGLNGGQITRAWALGSLSQENGEPSAGGLIGASDGVVADSFAKVKIHILSTFLSSGGGLIGYNRGSIESTQADGSIVYRKADEMDFGGLVGLNEGRIADSYAINAVHDGKQNDQTNAGGFVGRNDSGGRIASSYAAGPITQHNDTSSTIGGLVGRDSTKAGHIETSYWNLDMGVSDPKRGAGNRKNDPGITGLTTAQLQSGLPEGFDPKIWKQDTHKNHGLPYLASIPPK